MNYLLFGGAPDSGKTNAVLRLANVLQAPLFSMTISAGQMPRLKTTPLHPAYMADEDFMVILDGSDAEGKPIRVALNSKSDDNASIDDFKAFLAKQPPVDVIVSSVRNLYAVRQYLFATMPVTANDYYCEIPLAKFRQNLDWVQATDGYVAAVDRLALQILRNAPFGL